jgi:hypothetical protein
MLRIRALVLELKQEEQQKRSCNLTFLNFEEEGGENVLELGRHSLQRATSTNLCRLTA